MAKPVDLTIRIKADTGEVAPGMQKLDQQLETATRSAAALDNELGDISAHDVSLDVNTQAIDNARRRIDDLRDEIATMKAIDIDADTRKAEADIAKLKRSIKALGDDVSKPGGGVDIGHSMSRGLDEASEGVQEFGREAQSTAKESAASFDGSADSIVDAFQEVAANAFAGFGAAGLVAGLGVAAGIGFGIQALTQMSDAANKVTDDAIAMNDALGDAGTDEAARVEALSARWVEVGNAINDTRSIWEFWQPRSVTNMEKFAESARIAGLDVQALNDAFIDPDPQRRLEGLNAVIDQQKTKLREVKAALNTAGQGKDWTEEQSEHWEDQKDAIEGTVKALEAEVRVSKTAAELEAANARVRGVSIDVYREQVAAAEEAAAAQEAYNATLEASADPVTAYTDILSDKTADMKRLAQEHADSTKESTGEAADSWEDYATDVQVTTQDLIEEWTRQAEAAEAFERNLAIIGANGGQALADELRAKGPEVAGAAAEALASSPSAEQKAAIDAHMVATGKAATLEIARGIREQKEAIWAAIRSNFIGAPQYSPYVNTGPPPPGWSGLSAPAAPAPAAAGGGVRVYIDGNALRATIRGDVSAAAGRAALAGTGRGRP